MLSKESTSSTSSGRDDVDGDLTSPRKKRHKAEEQRKRLMKQMSDMQKKFFEKHKAELEILNEPSAVSP